MNTLLDGALVALGPVALFFIHKFLLWVFYLAVMQLREARDAGKLTARGMKWAKVALYIGLFLDLTYNLTWACLEFLDLPRELLVTSRLKRYKYGQDVSEWRRKKTEEYALDLLDPFDSDGKHV